MRASQQEQAGCRQHRAGRSCPGPLLAVSSTPSFQLSPAPRPPQGVCAALQPPGSVDVARGQRPRHSLHPAPADGLRARASHAGPHCLCRGRVAALPCLPTQGPCHGHGHCWPDAACLPAVTAAGPRPEALGCVAWWQRPHVCRDCPPLPLLRHRWGTPSISSPTAAWSSSCTARSAWAKVSACRTWRPPSARWLPPLWHPRQAWLRGGAGRAERCCKRCRGAGWSCSALPSCRGANPSRAPCRAATLMGRALHAGLSMHLSGPCRQASSSGPVASRPMN